MIDIQKTFTLYQVANWLNNEKYESPNIIIAHVIGRCFVNIRLYMILYLLKIQVCKLGVIIMIISRFLTLEIQLIFNEREHLGKKTEVL